MPSVEQVQQDLKHELQVCESQKLELYRLHQQQDASPQVT